MLGIFGGAAVLDTLFFHSGRTAILSFVGRLASSWRYYSCVGALMSILLERYCPFPLTVQRHLCIVVRDFGKITHFYKATHGMEQF